ncbi:MAG TPA: hypothetical protein VGO11_27000 [Chthoniobacteraceae bacterium]|jgi:hypothetical protein|nr:hypothetical protein [Chthoniobacteraceae bacterium]
MAGQVADRELTGVRFARATETDEAGIRRLLRENPMPGAISLTLEREPDYFRGADLAGAGDETIVAVENERVICMGRCSTRLAWVNGRATRVGYLAELRLDAAAHGRFALLRDGYRFFAEQRDPAVELHFTSIAADNERARRLLERGVRGLPRYSYLADLATVLIAVPRHPRAPALRVQPATAEDIPEIVRLLNEHARRHQLAAVWSAEMLTGLERHGLPLRDFSLVKDGGALVACGALWDQRAFRQTVIRGYSRRLAVLRPWMNAASRLFDTPRLPPASAALAHAFLSPLALARDADPLLPDLVAAFFPQAAARGLEFVTLALPASDPRLPALRRAFTTQTWQSRLYRVDWPEPASRVPFDSSLPCLPEVAFL